MTECSICLLKVDNGIASIRFIDPAQKIGSHYITSKVNATLLVPLLSNGDNIWRLVAFCERKNLSIAGELRLYLCVDWKLNEPEDWDAEIRLFCIFGKYNP